MTRLCFIDTETTSLRADRRAWEIGIIARGEDGSEAQHHWFITDDDLDLGNAETAALKVGKFYERHPQYRTDREFSWADVGFEADVLHEVEAITRAAHLVGAVVSFDADVLGQRMRARDMLPSWHYHLIDVEALAAGHLMNMARHYERLGNQSVTAELLAQTARPPWKSDELAAALGIAASEDEKHTALGDAKWAMRIYDAVMRAQDTE